MGRRAWFAVGCLALLAMPLTAAYVGIYPEPTRYTWSPATGPVEWYEACIADAQGESCHRAPYAWELRVRACAASGCGDWSVPRGIVPIPELGSLILLGVGIVGVTALRWVRR